MNNDQETKDILREILRWTKFRGMREVKQVLEATLDNDDKKLVYELSDGRSSSAIAKIVEVGGRTVRRYWKDWVVLGIMEVHPDYKRRCRRVFSLREIGIAVPHVERIVDQTEEEQTEGE